MEGEEVIINLKCSCGASIELSNNRVLGGTENVCVDELAKIWMEQHEACHSKPSFAGVCKEESKDTDAEGGHGE
jgi:hypothetical protein